MTGVVDVDASILSMTAALIVLAFVMLAVAAVLGWYAGMAAGRGTASGAAAQRDAAEPSVTGCGPSGTTSASGCPSRGRHRRARVDRRARAAGRDRALGRAEQDEARLRETFSSLSREALARSSSEFITLAETRLKQAGATADGDLAQRQQAIASMVTPLREALAKVEQQMRGVELQREGAYSALTEQVARCVRPRPNCGWRPSGSSPPCGSADPRPLGRDAARADRAQRRHGRALRLRDPGQCRRTRRHPASRSGGAARRRQEHRGRRQGSFIGFLEAMEATDDSTRTARLTAHARHLREHVDRLAAKNYWEAFDPTRSSW